MKTSTGQPGEHACDKHLYSWDLSTEELKGRQSSSQSALLLQLLLRPCWMSATSRKAAVSADGSTAMLPLQGGGPVGVPGIQEGGDEGGGPNGVPGTHMGETDGGGLVAVSL